MQKDIDRYSFSPLTSLPNDLKSIVFDFLPLSTCVRLQLVCRNFYFFFLTNPEIWAKHMYLLFLDPMIRQDVLIEDDQSEIKPSIVMDSIRLRGLTASRKILETYFELKGRWESFFSRFLPLTYSRELIQDIFLSLRSPYYPSPALKKDIHTFPTNTLFQNFLTEVQYGAHGMAFFMDKKHFMMKKAIESMKSSLLRVRIDTDKLISLRWYLFDRQKTIKRDPSLSNAHLVYGKHITKTKSILRNGQLHRVSEYSNNVDYSELAFQKKKSVRKESSRVHNADKLWKSSEFRLDSREDNSDILEFDNDLDGRMGPIEEFYDMIYVLVKNHCHMVFCYLKTIHEGESLLTEYIRFWSLFVLTIIDLNRELSPFSEFLNEVYNRNCKGLPNFPEFSIWRVMTKLWLYEVFTPLFSSFQSAFLSILMRIRLQNTLQKFTPTQLAEAFERLNPAQNTEGILLIKRILATRASDDLQTLNTHEDRDEALLLLRRFYHTVSDLSYDEFTVFYSNCSPVDSQTPKGILDVAVTKDTLDLYRYWNELLNCDPTIISCFTSDVHLIDHQFGKELSCRVRETKAKMLEAYLSEKFLTAVREHEFSTGLNFLMPPELATTIKVSNNIIAHVVNYLKPPEDIRKKVVEDKEYKESLYRVLTRGCPMFEPLIRLLGDTKEGLEYQYREFEEICMERTHRGFMLIDEKYENFFSLGRNPSFRLLKGLQEGSNIERSVGSDIGSRDQIF